MDLASIAITISAIIAVLQIVSIVLIAEMRKSIKTLKAAPTPSNERDRFEKREHDFRRHDRRPFQDQKPRQQTPAPSAAAAPPAGDAVEKSLRDINLRLKNAERDQEYARRKIQENLSRDPNLHRDDRDRRNRDHRDRYHNRRNNRHDRFDRHDRSDRFDRNRPPLQTSIPSGPAPVAKEEPPFDKTGAPPVDTQAPVGQTPVAAAGSDVTPTDFNADNLQHGRKIIVNRRPLNGAPESSTGTAEAPANETAPAPAATNPEEETTLSPAPPKDSEIHFGRR